MFFSFGINISFVPFVIFFSQPMSIPKQSNTMNHCEETAKTEKMLMSTPMKSKSRPQFSENMIKSQYSRQPSSHHRTNSYTINKATKPSEFILKKHQNKKFDKLVSLITYTINSADKALRFLDISCKFQAEFASKLYYSDRETLMGECNKFSLQDLPSQKSFSFYANTQEMKSMIMNSSLLVESKQLKSQNQKLKKQLILRQNQLGKDLRNVTWQSKSSQSFFTHHQSTDFKGLLMNKSCQQELPKEEFDFFEKENKRMSDLLRKICKFEEINEFLDVINKQTKWKIESINNEHTMSQRKSFESLAAANKKKIEDLFEKIITKTQLIYNASKAGEALKRENNKFKQIIKRIFSSIKMEHQGQEITAQNLEAIQATYQSILRQQQQEILFIKDELEEQFQIISKMNAKESEFRKKQIQFQLKLSEQDKIIIELTEQKQQITDKNRSFLSDIQEHEKYNLEIQSKRSRLKEEIELSRKSHEIEIQKLTLQCSALKNECFSKDQILKFQNNRIEKLSQSLKSIEKSFQQCQLENFKQRQSIQRFESDQVALKNQLTLSKIELEQLTSQNAQLRRQISILTKQNKDLIKCRAIIQDIKMENTRCLQQLKQIQWKLQQSSERLILRNREKQQIQQAFQLQKYNFHIKVNNYEQTINDLQSELNTSRKNIQLLNQAKNEIQNQIITQKQIIQTLHSNFTQLDQKMKQQLHQSNEKLSNVEANLSQSQNQKNFLKNEYETIVKILEKKQQQISESKSVQSNLMQQSLALNIHLNDTRLKSKQTITALQRLMQHLKEENHEIKQQNSQLNKTIHGLKEQSKNKDLKIHHQMIDSIEQLRLERDELRKIQQCIEKELEQKKSELQIQISLRQTMNYNITELQSYLKTIVEENIFKINEKEDLIKEMSNHIDQNEKITKSILDENESLRSKLIQIQQKENDLQIRINEQQNNRKNLQLEIQNHIANYNMLLDNETQLRDQLQKQSKLNIVSKRIVQMKQLQIRELSQNLLQMSNRITQLQEVITVKNISISKLQQEVIINSQLIAQQKQLNNEKQNQIEFFKLQLSREKSQRTTNLQLSRYQTEQLKKKVSLLLIQNEHLNSSINSLRDSLKLEIDQKQEITFLLEKLKNEHQNEILKNKNEINQFTQQYQQALSREINEKNQQKNESQRLLNKQSEQIHNFNVILQQNQRTIMQNSEEKQKMQNQLHKLFQELSQHCQNSNNIHEYQIQITRLKQELSFAHQHREKMQIQHVVMQNSINNLVINHQQQLSMMKNQFTYISQTQTSREKQLITISQQKEKKIQLYELNQAKMNKQMTQYLQQIKILKNQQDKLKKELSLRQKQEMQNLSYRLLNNQRSQRVKTEEKSQNQYEDFGDYLENKIDSSFNSIINSQAMNSWSFSKVDQILKGETQSNQFQSEKQEQSLDEFEDFSSSQRNEDIMYSFSSRNESVEQPSPIIFTFNPSKFDSNHIQTLQCDEHINANLSCMQIHDNHNLSQCIKHCQSQQNCCLNEQQMIKVYNNASVEISPQLLNENYNRKQLKRTYSFMQNELILENKQESNKRCLKQSKLNQKN